MTLGLFSSLAVFAIINEFGDAVINYFTRQTVCIQILNELIESSHLDIVPKFPIEVQQNLTQ